MPNRAETVLTLCLSFMTGLALAAIWGDRAAVADIVFRAVAFAPFALAFVMILAALAAVVRREGGRDA